MDAGKQDAGDTTPWVTVLVVGAVAVLGALVGLFESTFGPYYALLIAAGVAGLGLLMRRWQTAWGLLLIVFGIAMGAGALLYVVFGLIGQGAPGSGSGFG